jgi:6-phosphogluconolactonase
MLTIIHEPGTDLLLQRAAQYMCRKIREALAVGDSVNIAVPGGRSVAKVFEATRAEEVDWTRAHFFVIDERLVPVDHPDSNFKLFNEHFIMPLTREGRISPDNAHPFILDTSVPDQGTRAYEEALARHGSRFDIILLSSGEDGHVGALFPDHHSVHDSRRGFIVMHDSPKPPPGRMSASLPLMQGAGAAVLLFVGESKRSAFKRFKDASTPVSACPAKLALAMKDVAVFTDLAR